MMSPRPVFGLRASLEGLATWAILSTVQGPANWIGVVLSGTLGLTETACPHFDGGCSWQAALLALAQAAQSTEPVAAPWAVLLAVLGVIMALLFCAGAARRWLPPVTLPTVLSGLVAGHAALGYVVATSLMQQDLLLYLLRLVLREWPIFAMALLFTGVAVGLATFLSFHASSGLRQIELRKVYHVAAALLLAPLMAWHSDVFIVTGAVELVQAQLRDARDQGFLTVTPLYLLLGTLAPFWCLPRARFWAAYGGVLAVGIGDTFASLVGRRYGRWRLPVVEKSLEGFLACVVSQLVALWLLNWGGLIDGVPWHRALVACVTVAGLELSTTQIDNLVLPVAFVVAALSSWTG
ncbi:uncharacterized protein MONBRDRAFT_22886 [Monosiga brevicollis MX1]|uniref:dolichol kinase n=1 Tax=Monosiga brevicollis TaxID=81824 RepID=A9USD0_MONBE|nr:uncharacterized protein MONBRDRAFT_22886 [Monosiga brevicollis MX1]EDQ92079.1 predicted protein [Monosiga brevicollis MX1]|eukprot:XP_001743365.1 hypothetical protein [Monosiga brevicollis MX1]